MSEITTESSEQVNELGWDKEEKYLQVPSENYKELNRLLLEYETWMVDLFSPKGLLMLFPTLKGKK